MAFQISEKQLSELAQKCMSNTKNKAKFTRDAIEYYVRREEDLKEFLIMKEDIAEIKDLIKSIKSSGGQVVDIKDEELVKVEEPKKHESKKKTNKAEEVVVPGCYDE